MSQLKVNTIRHTSASSDAITLVNDGTATAKITNYPHRNLVINGAMQVAQRGTSTTTTNTMCVDRFKCFFAGHDEAPTFAQVDVTSNDPGPWEKGFRKALRITNGNQTGGVGAADECSIYHQIEAQDIANSGWDYTSASSYITLSFWLKSSVAQNFHGYLVTDDGTSQMYPFETGALSADTWKKVTLKIPGNSNITVNNDNGVGFAFSIAATWGSDYTVASPTLNAWTAWNGSERTKDTTTTWWTTNDAQFELTGVQLEVGDTATDFEHLSYGDELLRCQRYYFHQGSDSDYGFAIADNDNQWFDTEVVFPVQMRAAPTAVTNSGDSSEYSLRRDTTKTVTGGPNFNTAGTQAGVVRWGCSSHGWGTGAVVRSYPNDSDAFIGWSAEL